MVSRGELLLREILQFIILDKDVRYNCRDLDIVNPITGEQLEIDIYYPSLNLAFEFQGEQHYFKTGFADAKDVRNIRYRDMIKAEQCLKKKILLIVINASQLRPERIRYRLARRKNREIPLIPADEKNKINDPHNAALHKKCQAYRKYLDINFDNQTSAKYSNPVRWQRLYGNKT